MRKNDLLPLASQGGVGPHECSVSFISGRMSMGLVLCMSCAGNNHCEFRSAMATSCSGDSILQCSSSFSAPLHRVPSALEKVVYMSSLGLRTQHSLILWTFS